MQYNFNQLIDRCDTNAVKWMELKKHNCHNDVIPMWVADMDFEVANEIVEGFYKRLQCPVFGYTTATDGSIEALSDWFKRRYDYHFDKDDVILTISVLATLSLAINLLTSENDKILILTPSYHPFVDKTICNNRIALLAPLKIASNRYVIDYDYLDEIVDETCTMAIFCNPHNPTGLLFTKDEVIDFAKFCQKKKLKIFADEIHADFVFNGQKITPIMDVNQYTKNNTIAAVSISKTFNLAGLKASSAIIKNAELRASFIKKANCIGISSINIFGYQAMYQSYLYGENWLDQILMYLHDNREYCYDFIKTNMPKIGLIYPDATYFMWLDFTKTKLCDNVFDILLNEANVFVSNGKAFGDEYQAFARLNLALPRYLMIKALDNIKVVYDKYENEAR